MMTLTLAWIALPLIVGFSIYLLPQLARALTLVVSVVSVVYGLWHVLNPDPIVLSLVDSFGVRLIVDQLSGFFILTNAVVTAAVICYCWQTGKNAFFYTQAIILHGSMNSIFICADLISVYVALEVIGIAAFLLITYPRTDRAVWVGLRYLFVSNTAMLFYLLGAVLVYQSSRTFAFTALSGAPREAIALIFLGLLSKGGIFVSGLWLPLTHAEAETPVSALMSGVVVKAGVFPLIRFAMMMPELAPTVRIFGVSTALLGVSFAIFAQDTKRLLAFSTVSQLGFVLAAPAAGGFYALTHGLAKAALFLTAGNLHSRDFKVLKNNPISVSRWAVLAIAGCSVMGVPLLAGFGAKTLTSEALLPWQSNLLIFATVGTAIAMAKLIFIPRASHDSDTDGKETVKQKTVSAGYWLAVGLLLGGLFLANGLYPDAYSLKNFAKPAVIISIGWLIYFFVIQRVSVSVSRVVEQFDHLIGAMSLVLTLLFWMVLT